MRAVAVPVGVRQGGVLTCVVVVRFIVGVMVMSFVGCGFISVYVWLETLHAVCVWVGL